VSFLTFLLLVSLLLPEETETFGAHVCRTRCSQQRYNNNNAPFVAELYNLRQRQPRAEHSAGLQLHYAGNPSRFMNRSRSNSDRRTQRVFTLIVSRGGRSEGGERPLDPARPHAGKLIRLRRNEHRDRLAWMQKPFARVCVHVCACIRACMRVRDIRADESQDVRRARDKANAPDSIRGMCASCSPGINISR